MNLKESFRYQNFLKKLLIECKDYMYHPDNFITRTQAHNRSVAIESGKDEVITVEKPNNYSFNCMEVVEFGNHILKQIELLAYAISSAKRNCEFDIDAALGINKERQEFVDYLSTICKYKNSEKKQKAYGNAFNVNGDPIRYEYEVVETSTIDFDKSFIKVMINNISRSADEISLMVDEINLTTEVDYTPEFNYTDSFEDCIERYISTKNW